jgi:putative transposase
MRIDGVRQPRQLAEGARYHVTARANRKEMILESVAMKELFLSVVKRAKAKYKFRLENFCIMGNHYHLIIQPSRGENLSAIMRWIMSVFAMAYNKVKGITGHVWGCRFFSRIIESLAELMRIFEYIDNNPIRANQVEGRREWRWCGLWHDRTGCRDLVDAPAIWVGQLLPGHAQLAISQKRQTLTC